MISKELPLVLLTVSAFKTHSLQLKSINAPANKIINGIGKLLNANTSLIAHRILSRQELNSQPNANAEREPNGILIHSNVNK